MGDSYIRELRKSGYLLKEISDITGVSVAKISRLCKGIEVEKVDKKEVVRLRGKGLSQKEIALELNVSESTVQRVCKELGMSKKISRVRVLDIVSDDELRSLREQGMSLSDIANRFYVSRALVYKELKMRSIK